MTNQLPREDQQLREKAVVRLTLEGLTAERVAAQVGVTARTVQRIRVRCGVTARPRSYPMTAEELRRAEEMLDDGASRAEVARTLGRSELAMRRRFPGRGWAVGSGNEFRRMLAALDAIPPNIVSLRKQFRDPQAISIHPQLRTMRAAFNAIPEAVAP